MVGVRADARRAAHVDVSAVVHGKHLVRARNYGFGFAFGFGLRLGSGFGFGFGFAFWVRVGLGLGIGLGLGLGAGLERVDCRSLLEVLTRQDAYS